MPEASIGRIVQYVIGEGRSEGQSRPAQITSIFEQPEAPPLLNLVVTLDGSNDFETVQGPPDKRRGRYERYVADPPVLHEWATSVVHATAVGNPPTYPPGTWHWPPGVS